MAMTALTLWIAAGITAAGGGGMTDQTMPPARLALALKVAGQGLPHCRSYLADGSEEPCLPRFALRRGSGINGWSRGGAIAFTHKAATRLSDDEFALLAGHEIAHWYLGHQGSTRASEQAADRLGAELACRAGFDLVKGASLFGHLRPSRHHPPAAERRAAVLAVGCGGARAVVALADGGRQLDRSVNLSSERHAVITLKSVIYAAA